MYTIARPINGISLNGKEYLLNEDGTVMQFETEAAAVQFLLDNGVEPQAIEQGAVLIELEEE